ncbi:MAG TPA: hypothetical protein VEH04_17145 [Verrucomicrobiae bacterium]|nr:hypothetical protein [Verrucomicrobiae bacterium]
MITHKDARHITLRAKGGKARRVRIMRPSLRQLGVKARHLDHRVAGLKSALHHLKPGQGDEQLRLNQMLGSVRSRQEALQKHLDSLAA